MLRQILPTLNIRGLRAAVVSIAADAANAGLRPGEERALELRSKPLGAQLLSQGRSDDL